MPRGAIILIVTSNFCPHRAWAEVKGRGTFIIYAVTKVAMALRFNDSNSCDETINALEGGFVRS